MKKNLLSLAAVMVFASSSWAVETTNIHEQVNNAQAPAHQMQSSSEKSDIQGDSMKMMNMDEHEQAAASHEMMKNNKSAAHQSMAEMHRKMKKTKPAATTDTTKPFSEMNEHEKAAVVHEGTNNGKANAHQQQAEEHNSKIPQN
ncbi:putative copper-binding protein PcoE precursor [Phytobacter ursingii]|nr:putative copper-binding protein PcoE precursor [Phytobacter ursingii]